MEMIERYITLVGQNLPAKISEDIQKEIRSLIEDTLEDESQAAGRAVDEAMVADVLQRLGPPEKMAASYLPPRYLIGPELFPHFITTLRIVLSIVTVLVMIGLGISLAVNDAASTGIGDVVLQVFTGLLGAVFQASAVVVLVFAVMEWAGAELKGKEKEKPWDPRLMKVEPNPQRVKIGDLVADLIFTFVILVVMNFYPQWIGLNSYVDGAWRHVPVLTEAFLRFLPWLSLVWVLDILKSVLLLAYGRWTTGLRWYALAVGVATIVVAAWMLSEPVLAAVDPASFNRLGWGGLDPHTLTQVNWGLNLSVRMTVGIVLVVEAVKLGQGLYQMFLKNRLPALNSPQG